jgi:hypothetical protein
VFLVGDDLPEFEQDNAWWLYPRGPPENGPVILAELLSYRKKLGNWAKNTRVRAETTLLQTEEKGIPASGI